MAFGNSVNDEVREQHRLMKDKPLKEQLEYYAGYYWKHALIITAALIVAGSMIHSFITAKEEALCVLFVNTFVKEDIDTEAYGIEFAQQQGLDPKDYSINIQRDVWISYDNMDELSSANVQKLLVLNAAGTLDAMVVDDTYLEHNAKTGILGDLSEVIPAEILAKYEDRITYVDVDGDDKGEYPACIDVSDASIMESEELPAYFCVVQFTPHPETVTAYLEYLMSK